MDPPTPIRIFTTGTSSLQHQGQTSWRPLPSSSSHHNSQSLQGLLAPAPGSLLPTSSNHSNLLQPGLLAPGMPAPPTAYFQQPQQLAPARAPGIWMPALTAIYFQQPQQLASTRAPGARMPAPPAAYFQQPQQLAVPGAPGTGLPVPYARMQGSSISQLHQPQQLMSAGVVGTRMPAPGLPPQQATTNFTLSTANLPVHTTNWMITSPSFSIWPSVLVVTVSTNTNTIHITQFN